MTMKKRLGKKTSMSQKQLMARNQLTMELMNERIDAMNLDCQQDQNLPSYCSMCTDCTQKVATSKGSSLIAQLTPLPGDVQLQSATISANPSNRDDLNNNVKRYLIDNAHRMNLTNSLKEKGNLLEIGSSEQVTRSPSHTIIKTQMPPNLASSLATIATTTSTNTKTTNSSTNPSRFSSSNANSFQGSQNSKRSQVSSSATTISFQSTATSSTNNILHNEREPQRHQQSSASDLTTSSACCSYSLTRTGSCLSELSSESGVPMRLTNHIHHGHDSIDYLQDQEEAEIEIIMDDEDYDEEEDEQESQNKSDIQYDGQLEEEANMTEEEKQVLINVLEKRIEMLNDKLDDHLRVYESLVAQEKALLGAHNLDLFTNEGVNNFHLHQHQLLSTQQQPSHQNQQISSPQATVS